MPNASKATDKNNLDDYVKKYSLRNHSRLILKSNKTAHEEYKRKGGGKEPQNWGKMSWLSITNNQKNFWVP